MRQLIIFNRGAHAKQCAFELAQRIPGAIFRMNRESARQTVEISDAAWSYDLVSKDYDPRRLAGIRYDLVTYDHGVLLDDETRFLFESLVR